VRAPIDEIGLLGVAISFFGSRGFATEAATSAFSIGEV
jgi:hypothetical protein